MNILTKTAAVAALMTAGSFAFAESHTAATDTMSTDMSSSENLIRSRDITGGTIYRMDIETDNGMWDGNQMYDTVDADWNDIGEIEDIVLNKDGQMIGIVAEVGGFLGIGDKHVMLPIQDVRLTAVDDKTYGYVTQKTDEELEAMESVDEGFWD